MNAKAQNIASIRELASSTVTLAMNLQLPPFDSRQFKGEEDVIRRLSEWTAKARQQAQFARSLTAAMERLASTASFIDREDERLTLFQTAEALIKKEDSPIAKKAYDAALIAEAVKQGFKVH